MLKFALTPKSLLKLGLISSGAGSSVYYHEEITNFSLGALRIGRAAKTVLGIVMDYKKTLYYNKIPLSTEEYQKETSNVHTRSANRLLDLCCINGGSYIKVGQHLGSLEYLLPMEYVNTLKILHSEAPKSSLESIYKVIQQELKQNPSELFESFDSEPLGAASLAQVHRATLKDGREVAVKVQHPEVLNHSLIDLKSMETLTKVVSKIFPDFKFDWLVKEIKRNLPKELDFRNEGENAEAVAKMFAHYPWLKVPSIEWDLSTDRVLTMEFFDGGKVNDLEYYKKNGINCADVTEKIGKLYAEMIFVRGFVHCDPHPGNILVKKNGRKTDIILLDHGLYLNLTEQFRLTYAKFWQSILNANVNDIEEYSKQLGVGELFGLFACMATGRSWKSISKGINKKKMSSDELDEIKSDASKFMPQIIEVLARVPREMILIFKTNDCIRGIEFTLKINHSMKSFLSMSRCCIKAVYDHRRKFCTTWLCTIVTNASETLAQFKINAYSLYLTLLRIPRFFASLSL